MSNTSQVAANTAVQSQASSKQQTLAAMVFGALVVLAVGFLPLDVAHNAAHDTRHSLVFPCH